MSTEKNTRSTDGGNGSGDGVHDNSYLQLREAKIARNRDKLARLGLAGNFHHQNQHKAASISITESKNENRNSEQSRNRNRNGNGNNVDPIHPPVTTTRRSNRLLGRKRPSPSSTGSDQDDAKHPLAASMVANNGSSSVVRETANIEVSSSSASVQQLSNTKRIRASSSSSSKKPITIQKNEPKPGTTRATDINIRQVLYGNFDYPIFVGRRLTQTGKAAVVEHANFMCSNGSGISFNKYSGVCEFRNDVLFLWVNIDAPDADVRNDFLNDGKQIVWWGGSRMHDGSPVIQRLISIGRKCGIDDDKDNGNDNKDEKGRIIDDSCGIILWCRLYNKSKRTFDPYICMGRLGYHSHDVGSQPVRFIFDLLDHEYLKRASALDGTNHYQAIISNSIA